MQNYDDFTASHIFCNDKNNNTIYINDEGQKYIINDSKLKQKLQDIEGYRSFIYPEIKRRFISFLPAMFISSILLFIYNILFNEPTETIMTVVMMGTYLSIHLYLPYIFHKKISDILQKCSIVHEDNNV
ncbi:hypothetical protein [Sulfurovum mangrovi]|uniref:hypothetical protein n=1 Tax=Sulfurovum mangrovi TaxID=2893889 RepID=UPI001E44CC1E|nr:hypothetical protein [Sulfurovum mangrovi]UFH59551.1 hypothetical protein LN246_01570 [Sulfurovum mangrovi]UFH60694.1 hypothetical protein LN246_14115 [Sulfurovum mangrovi]